MSDLGTTSTRQAPDAASSINQRLFETSLDLILVVDGYGGFLRVSPSSLAILGYRADEMVGRNATDFIYAGDLEKTRNEMRQARRGRVTRNFDCRYVHQRGQPVPLSWTGVWSEADQQYFFIGRDMTEWLAAEEKLRRAQRLEAVGQLTGGIAHDFNNLLALIVGNVELMFDEPALSPKVLEYGRAALHAAQRGAELTRGLLAFARKQPLEPRVVDVNELVGNLAILLGRTLGQHVEVTFSGAADLWPAFLDPANLESAIANLAVNARDAMPGGGRLMIETRNEILDAEYAQENPGVTAGEYVSLVATDTGSGMSPEVQNRIFEPFFTTKDPGKGTGLGLSMVFGFVKQSGGHMKVYSELGHGTSFRLYFPRCRAADTTAEKWTAEQTPVRGHERILVVEDNDAIRQLVLIQLSRLGYRTLEAGGAEAALAILEAGEPVDLLFTDIIMLGDMTGHELAREATSRHPGLKVLFTSGFPENAVGGEGGPVAAAFLVKPYRFQELARKLREVLETA
jgi:PAS domain S-box-containing protein